MHRILFALAGLTTLAGAAQAQLPWQSGIGAATVSSGCTPFAVGTAGATTYTADCTGTMDIKVWGPGGSGGGSSTATTPGGGAGAFARHATFAVTSGHVYNVVDGAGGAASTSFNSGGGPSYFCDQATSGCTAALTSCALTGSLSSSNFVCADFGLAATSGNPAGGQASASVGATATFNGGSGHAGGTICDPGGGDFTPGGDGGGAAGPDGAGGNAPVQPGAGNACLRAGQGDNGSGGLGGFPAVTGGGAGTTDTAHGGGGAGGGSAGGANGGAPGGGGSGAWNSGSSGAGADGRVAGS